MRKGSLIILYLAVSSVAAATIIHVPSEYPTIQSGIEAAVDGDTVLVAAGTYTGTGNKNLDFGGRIIVVKSENGPESCLIDCENEGRGFYFHSGENPNAVLSGFKIINGNTLQSAFDRGGGIYCTNAGPAIKNCIIDENTAMFGGGVYLSEDNCITIENCIISDNYATGNGGGLFCYGTAALISDCEICGNAADWYGGGICCDEANPQIRDCFVNRNSADDGGGIGCETFSSPEIIGCTISENTSAHYGGGIQCAKYSSPAVEQCIIRDNSAGWRGGGIHLDESISDFIRCLFIGNSASDGGGLSLTASAPTVSNCTVSGNSADFTGGGINCNGSAVIINNTIVSGNEDGGGIYFDQYGEVTVTYGDFHANAGGNFTGFIPHGLGEIVSANLNGDSCDINSNIFLDPLFYSLTGDSAFHLTGLSPCIDAGDPDSPLDPDSTGADLGTYYYDQNITHVPVPGRPVAPAGFSLLPPCPNPFNATTAISFKLQASSRVELKVFDITGREAASLVNSHLSPGTHEIVWDAEGLGSGVYFVRLEAGDFAQTRKMLLVK